MQRVVCQLLFNLIDEEGEEEEEEEEKLRVAVMHQSGCHLLFNRTEKKEYKKRKLFKNYLKPLKFKFNR